MKNVWGNEYKGVHDHVYARAVVLDNGLTSAALVSVDASGVNSLAARRRIEKETGIPFERILVSATHTHNAVAINAAAVVPPQPAASGAPANLRAPTAQSVAFGVGAENAVVEVVRQAKANLQPGKIGLAAGRADINVNRNEFVGDRWKTGRDPTGPSDKTVWVMRFDNAAGEPIALFVNYAAHPLVLGPDNDLITGDMPGAMSRFVESYYKDKAVALFAQSASGDQNLIASSWDLDDKLTHKVREPGEQGFQIADALGRILGEEAIRAGDTIRNGSSTASIWSTSAEPTCPAGRSANQGAQPPASTGAARATPIDMTLLMINNIALAAVAAEVFTNIYYHLRQDSPLTNTMMVTITNGSVSYIADDAAYGVGKFGARSGSPFQGCGEATIVNFFVGGINRRLSTMDARH